METKTAMAEWTPEALEYLEGYLTQVKALARQAGEDPDEVAGGLKEHILSKVDETSPSLATIDQLRRALAEVGTPEEILAVDPEARDFKAAGSPNSTVSRQPAAQSTLPNSTAASRPRRWTVFSFLIAILLVPVLLFGPVILYLSWMHVSSIEQTQIVAAEKQMAAVLRVIAALEMEFIKSGKHDADGDGVPDYATLEQLQQDNNGLGIDAGGTKGAYLINIVVTESAQEGGPWFYCTAKPLLDKGLSMMLIDPTGEIYHNMPASYSADSPKSALSELEAVGALQDIAVAQQAYFKQRGRFGNMEELCGATLVGTRYDQTGAGGYIINLRVPDHGAAFTCTAIPPHEAGPRRSVMIDQGGKLFFMRSGAAPELQIVH